MTQPLRILVADDDAEMTEYYGRIIPALGHVILAAVDNGLELVDACRGLRPSLVISDIRMPELDGLSAMESVQHRCCIPFIFVTAENPTDHCSRLRRGHVLKYLQKPVRRTELASALKPPAAICKWHGRLALSGHERDRLDPRSGARPATPRDMVLRHEVPAGVVLTLRARGVRCMSFAAPRTLFVVVMLSTSSPLTGGCYRTSMAERLRKRQNSRTAGRRAGV